MSEGHRQTKISNEVDTSTDHLKIAFSSSLPGSSGSRNIKAKVPELKLSQCRFRKIDILFEEVTKGSKYCVTYVMDTAKNLASFTSAMLSYHGECQWHHILRCRRMSSTFHKMFS